MTEHNATTTLHIRLPADLVARIDAAKDDEMARSAWVRGAIRLRLDNARDAARGARARSPQSTSSRNDAAPAAGEPARSLTGTPASPPAPGHASEPPQASAQAAQPPQPARQHLWQRSGSKTVCSRCSVNREFAGVEPCLITGSPSEPPW